MSPPAASPPMEFQAASHKGRIYSGSHALADLPREVRRLGARRVFLLCGNSVARHTSLIDQLRLLLAERYAGCHDRVARHASEASMAAAVAQARAAGADCLVAVGAGTVCMAARIVAILLAEPAPLDALVTQYREGAPATSPRLDAPKIPIINVLTAPTSAQNGAGATLKATDGRRLELYDPKTRAAAIFWDGDALATAPASLSIAAGLSVFWWSFMRIGGVEAANPLVQGDRRQSLALALDAHTRMGDPVDTDARIAMCAAAYMQNRDLDQGGRPFELHWVVRVCYALGAGVFMQDDAISPGLAYLALTGPAISHFGDRNLPELRAMCVAIGACEATAAAHAGPAELRACVDTFFARAGFTPRLRELGVARDALPAIRDGALTNFNADRNREFVREIDKLDKVLADAY